MEQEFVVAGYTQSDARRSLVLILATLDENGALRYAGRVETGPALPVRHRLTRLLAPLVRDTSPFPRQVPRAIRLTTRWLDPSMVVRVAFAEFTPDGMVRHPIFRGIRAAAGLKAELVAKRRPP